VRPAIERHDFLKREIADRLVDRLGDVRRPSLALDLGSHATNGHALGGFDRRAVGARDLGRVRPRRGPPSSPTRSSCPLRRRASTWC
jgi:hypothetical protein